jgi:hypothetical protein
MTLPFTIPTRTSKDLNSAADVNALMDNDEYLEAGKAGIISTDTVFEIGTGGDYADLQAALEDLCKYSIADGATVTLKLIAGFSPVNVTQVHPQGGSIVIDFNGNNYEVTTGNAFTAQYGGTLRFTNTGAAIVIQTADNGVGYGLLASDGGIINISTSSQLITVGANGKGFLRNVLIQKFSSFSADYFKSTYATEFNMQSAYSSSILVDTYVGSYAGQNDTVCSGNSYIRYTVSNISYAGADGVYSVENSFVVCINSVVANNTRYGFKSSNGGGIDRDGASGADATDSSPAVGAADTFGSFID